MQFDYYELLASTCRDSYFEFVKNFWGTIVRDPLVLNWHIKYLCDEIQEALERVFRGEDNVNDLLVNIAPGTSKSTLFSVMLTPWAWTRMPHFRMIGASYTDALALDLSGKSRQIVESPLYQRTFPEIRLSKDTNSKSHWQNTRGGDRYAVAVGGSVTGMHAHGIVIDDPIDPKGVRSKADLETANIWCKETISSRKVNKDLTPTFVVMQRLHQNDPSELYIARGVRHICVPGEDTPKIHPPELREKYQNGLFDPIRLSRSILSRMQMELGQFGYSGQILQDPIPLGGGMFKPERMIEVEYPLGAEQFKRIVRYWDKACLVAGTQIVTIDGNMPIETVQQGQTVWTTKGYKKVKWAGKSKTTQHLVTVVLSDGRSITGTPDHKTLTLNRNWVELASLWCGDIIQKHFTEEYQCQSQEIPTCKQSNLTDYDTPENLEPVTSTATSGIGNRNDTHIEPSIEMCGNPQTKGAYPKAIISTILTETSIITHRKICNAYRHQSIGNSMNLNIDDTLQITPSLIQKIDNEHWMAFACGSTEPQTIQKLSEIASKRAKNHGKQELYTDNAHANIAEVFSKREQIKLRNFVHANAAKRQGPLGKSPKERSHARTAKRRFWDVEELDSVAMPAYLNLAGVPVFDLTVQDQPEFLANGILVHNCTKGGGDYSVGVKMGLHKDGSYWILDIVRGQWSTDERERKIVETAARDGKSVRIGMEREPGSSGIDSVKDSIKRLSGFIVTANPVSGKKEIRADTFSVQVNAGNVYIVKGAYVKPYFEELAFFPNGKNDDQVDASSGAFQMLDKTKTQLGVL